MAMFDKVLHHKLLTDGLEGKGVITERKVVGAKNQFGVMGLLRRSRRSHQVR
jgi:hypothetical protein